MLILLGAKGQPSGNGYPAAGGQATTSPLQGDVSLLSADQVTATIPGMEGHDDWICCVGT